MSKVEEVQEDRLRQLTGRVHYLEAKVAFFRRYAEDLLGSAAPAPMEPSSDKLARAQDEIARLREANRLLEERIGLIFNTVSWRVTAPLRSVRTLFNKVRAR